MASASIPVDLRNPGQVFACLGFMEAAEILCGACEGAFDYVGSKTLTTFRLATAGESNPIEEPLRFLESARVQAIAPANRVPDKMLSAKRWNVETVPANSTSYPFDPPNTPATLATALVDDSGRMIAIDHFGDSSKSGRDNVKFWAGSGGYPGAALARDALELLQHDCAKPLSSTSKDPFSVSARQSSSFRFDWRRDYVPLDIGFSPNSHGNMVMVGYPIVELLAAIGLQNARPRRPDRRNKLVYCYGVSNTVLPTAYVRAVLGTQGLNFPMRIFRMRMDWPGQEGQARCIIDAREEGLT